MGGGSNSSPPSDTPPGGGTYPVDSFGNAYNPAWGSGGWTGGIGQGLQQFGQSVAQGSQFTPHFQSTPNLQQFTIPSTSQSQSALIPKNDSTDAESQQILKLLQQILGQGSGGYG